MERRLQFILSAILMALAGFNGHGQSQIFGAGGYYYEITSSTSTPPQVQVIGRDAGLGTEVTIPVTVNHNGTDYDVTAIRKQAFDNQQLTKVTFTDTPGTPSKLISIGESAFHNNQLEEVAIPNSVTSIGNWAFTDNQLDSVTFTDTPGTPSKLISIGSSAFHNNQLEEVAIPNSVTSIGESAFHNNQLEEVAIPNSVTSIGDWAFADNQLDSVTFTDTPGTPSKLISIGSSAFQNNQLEEVAIPNSVISIGGWAFRDNQLTEVAIPNSVTSIGESAFQNNQLEEVAMPNSVTSIGNWAFAGNQLDSVTFTDTPGTPSKLTSIGSRAFQNNQLEEVAIPNSVTSIGNRAFADNQLDSVTFTDTPGTPSKLTSIGSRAFRNNQLEEVTIPGSVTSIGSHAFAYNELTEVTIEADDPPALDADAFQHPGRGQIDLIVPAGRRQAYLDNEQWTGFKSITIKTFAVDGIRYGIISPTEVEVLGYTGTATEVAIPPTAHDGTRTFDVTAIGNSAFPGKGLTEVTIPDGVTSIGEDAFYNNQLTSIVIPENVTSLGQRAFGTNDLTEVTIPNSITHITKWAFAQNQLTEVTIPSNVVSIGHQAFLGLGSTNPIDVVTVKANDPPELDPTAFANQGKNHENIDLVVPRGTLDAYKHLTNGWTDFKSITEIAAVENTFTVDDIIYQITTLNLTNEVAVIDYTGNVTEVIIPKTIKYGPTDYKVTAIGDFAFYIQYLSPQTRGPVTKVTFDLPSNVTSIGEDAFYNNQLTSIVIPESVTSLGQRAFGINDLTEVTIPNSIAHITKWAFAQNKLTEVTIPASVNSIGDQAFYGNRSLDLVMLEADNPPGVHESAFSLTPYNKALVIPFGARAAYEEPANGWTSFKFITHGVFTDSDIRYGIISPTEVEVIAHTGSALEVEIPKTVNDNSETYTVTAIGYQVFMDKGLTRVTIPDGVTSIGVKAFLRCQLTQVTIPNTVTSIGRDAFQANKLTEVTFSTSSDLTSLEEGVFKNNKLTRVTIPDGVTSIGNSAFSQNELIKMTIPASVNSIDVWAFDGSSNIHTIFVKANDPPSLAANALEGDRSQTDLIVPPGRRQAYLDDEQWTGFRSITIKTFTVDGIIYGIISSTEVKVVAYIGTATEVTIPPTADDGIRTFNVTAIGNRAFLGKGLTSVTMPDGLTSIEHSAFQDNQLTSVTMPDGVTGIGHSAFRDNQLTSMTIPDGAISIGHSAFQNNDLSSVIIPNSVTSIGHSTFHNNKLTHVTIPDGVTSIGDNTFQNNKLTEVAIPDGVTRIGHSAFHNNRLSHVVIPDGVTDIGDNTFQNNDLSSVIIPNSIASVGRWAFGDNPYLGMMTVEADDPPALDADAFGGFYDNDTNLRGQIHLIVPPGRVQAYLDNGWKGFKSISDGSDLPLPTIGAPQSVGDLGTFTVDITFDGEVTGFDLEDIQVTHATVSALTGSGPIYTATLEPTSLCDGASITIDVPANVSESNTTGLPNQAATQVIVAVVDAIAPTIACPADVVANAADNGADDCTTTVALGSPIAEDNCSVAAVVAQVNGVDIDPDSYAFGIGTTTVTWMVSDGSGNTASCQQTVTLEEPLDNLVAMAKDITVQLDANGQATISPDMVDNGSSYGCGGTPNLSLDIDTFDCDDVGAPVTVILTAAQGDNSDTATVLVTVEAAGNCELGPLTDFNRGFSPNGDGIGDTLVIEGLEHYRNNVVKIYDLSQRLLFSAHYGGLGDAWDGTHEGGTVPVGSYVCVIDYNEPGLGHETKMIYVNY
ncbi:leucine-rich repeat protein [Muricauda sp. SCSIO 64092]|uniref:leucine-rich repeat protein n=1 Tax=Allomuricauda sp. SCSIO 64092 TaxID=2908842 RepID=UPI001FF4AC30|nr:leucine-rich repeat protein [Muricauda sp. SCSIO 64092]UOY06364.1 leucine-rich repeat protein [Muricauda sp. SCSIO 64092]